MSCSGADAEAQYAELAALEQALGGLALQRTVERSQLLVAATRTRFAAGLARLAAGKKTKVGPGTSQAVAVMSHSSHCFNLRPQEATFSTTAEVEHCCAPY